MRLITEKGIIAYPELLKMSERYASYIDQRSLIFLLCDNQLDCISAYVGWMRKNHVIALLPAILPEIQLLALLQQYQPDYVMLCAKNHYQIDGEIVFQSDGYQLIKTSFEQNYGLHPDLALLLTTSGSTGSPKFVRLSHQNIQSNTKAIVQYLSLTKNDCAITTMPLHYSYGLSVLNTHLYVGGSMVLTDRTLFDPVFWQLFMDHEVTSFNGVPYAFEMLRRLKFDQKNWPALRYLTQAGGKLKKEAVLHWASWCQKMNKAFFVMYGQTEASPRMSYLSIEDALEKPSSIGRAIPGGIFSIDPIGELIYQGDNVCMGYATGYTDLSKGDENHGILHTGDLALQDTEGFYYITGRKKRFIKWYGHRISLDELENILSTYGVSAACLGAENQLMVYLENGTPEQAKEILMTQLQLNMSAAAFITLEKLPRNDAGKIAYAALA